MKTKGNNNASRDGSVLWHSVHKFKTDTKSKPQSQDAPVSDDSQIYKLPAIDNNNSVNKQQVKEKDRTQRKQEKKNPREETERSES